MPILARCGAAQPRCEADRITATYAVKFKLIRSLSHNLSHSFMSGMNYFDGDHVYPHVYAMARANRGHTVTINWIPETTAELSQFPPRVRKSIVAYRTRVPDLMKRHKVTPDMLKSLRTEVYVARNFRLYVRAVALDSRGKEYAQFVWA
jgi:hypothetical protein